MSIAAWIQALPPDAIASVVRAYEHAEDDANARGAPFADVMTEGSRAFREALLSLAPKSAPVLPRCNIDSGGNICNRVLLCPTHEVTTPIDAQPSAERAAPPKECPYCEGRGWNVITVSAHGCGGDEERCAQTCPVPEQAQEQCAACEGTGVARPKEGT